MKVVLRMLGQTEHCISRSMLDQQKSNVVLLEELGHPRALVRVDGVLENQGK